MIKDLRLITGFFSKKYGGPSSLLVHVVVVVEEKVMGGLRILENRADEQT